MNSATVFAGTDGLDYHYIRAAANVRDWRNVADESEIELFVKRRVYRVRQADKQERIAVGRCPHDAFGADIAAGARSVLNKPLGLPIEHCQSGTKENTA
jgi:hypothetical protein